MLKRVRVGLGLVSGGQGRWTTSNLSVFVVFVLFLTFEFSFLFHVMLVSHGIPKSGFKVFMKPNLT